MPTSFFLGRVLSHTKYRTSLPPCPLLGFVISYLCFPSFARVLRPLGLDLLFIFLDHIILGRTAFGLALFKHELPLLSVLFLFEPVLDKLAEHLLFFLNLDFCLAVFRFALHVALEVLFDRVDAATALVLLAIIMAPVRSTA